MKSAQAKAWAAWAVPPALQWNYFDAMDRILGHRPSTVPESVVDSLALTQSEENISGSPELPEDIDEVDETVLADVSNLDDTVVPESEGDTTGVKKSGSKKKHSRGDQFEVVMNGVMKELVSAQERNEE